MKKVFKPFMVAAVIAGLATVSSCSKTCDPGYEGNDCKTESRTKFQGTWTATEAPTGGGQSSVFSVSIGADPSSVQGVLIGNFSDVFINTVHATVDGNAFTIPTQNPDGDVYDVISGTGTINNASNSISIQYTVKNTDTGNSYSYSGSWAK